MNKPQKKKKKSEDQPGVVEAVPLADGCVLAIGRVMAAQRVAPVVGDSVKVVRGALCREGTRTIKHKE